MRPVHGDILLAKLAPGQAIDLFMIAQKGLGKDHAKFSPVCTAAYRLLPSVTLSSASPFENEEASELVARCPAKVFDIEDIAGESVPWKVYVALKRSFYVVENVKVGQ